MPVVLGLDIGSNSVGSAWVDTERRIIQCGVSVFPAGVEETDAKRGSPKGKKRRDKRSQRRSLSRRAERKRHLRTLLTECGLLPTDPEKLKKLLETNPWRLRREGLTRALSPGEFGRVLIHLNQRRGALGIETDSDDPDEGKVKDAIDHLAQEMKRRGAKTFGQFIADLMDERAHPLDGRTRECYRDPVRNRRDSFEFHADRALIRREFKKLWDKQTSLPGETARLLTKDLRRRLDDPDEEGIWRCKGLLFGQRRTYWDTGTLGRCDLEPTDHRCPIADMHAQQFRVLESVNNIRIQARDEAPRSLTAEERRKVIEALRSQKTGSIATVRRALGIHKKAVRDFFSLNIERDPGREINTDWFHREIVQGAITEAAWNQFGQEQQDSVNRALLRFDPTNEADAVRLRQGAAKWWGLPDETAAKLVAGWKTRPKLEKRLNLSRRAIRNLLPYMDEFDEVNERWPTQIEARQRFAEDGANAATDEQRRRYALGSGRLTKGQRRFLRKHPNLLPPAPTLSNPVVRKAVHEVRRHISAYLRKFGRKPDRIVIEFARAAKQSGKVRQGILDLNRRREGIRKRIVSEHGLEALTLNQQKAAVDRVILCRQQRMVCAYTGETITEAMAVKGDGVEIDHIVPYSRSGDNSLSNKVLCRRDSNRKKSSQTPREWLGDAFGELLQRLAHFEKYKPPKGDAAEYFTKKDYGRKWENLTREVRPEDEWAKSQLTDSAYAARQVATYLGDALYGCASEGTRPICVTKGAYTARLRRDWQLFQTLRPARPRNGSGPQGNESSAQLAEKNRGDHRHHAIDAVVIALTGPEIIPRLARQAAEAEEHHARTGHWPPRKPFDPPWGTVGTFRRDVLSGLFSTFDATDGERSETGRPLVVSHRPVKRKIVGALHKEKPYGPVAGRDTLFTNRIGAESLRPKHLRPPRQETQKEAVERLAAAYGRTGLSVKDARKRARDAVNSLGYTPKIIDPPPERSGIVRDGELRRCIRQCLEAHGLDPDHFTEGQIKKLVAADKLCMPSGVPIRRVILLHTNTHPVIIPRKQLDPATGKMLPQMDPDDPGKPHTRTKRIYFGRNNHHIEIREDPNTGNWSGGIISTFEVAQRLSDRLRNLAQLEKPFRHLRRRLTKEKRRELSKEQIRELSKRRISEWKRSMHKIKPQREAIIAAHPLIDRSDNEQGRFVMSLSEGEMLYARRKDRPEEPPNYYAVCKLDKKGRIHFAPHWDARKAPPSGKKKRTSEHQDRWDVTPADLKDCGPEPGKPPVKVRVGALGDVTGLVGD